ncbi:sensor domain-containing diguanylate cyclase [Atopomonas sediminilitoris]|uniref:sensor domain-containing diguanylate cyclase n=1 Tax=Atopomonas sediminilitoris TaxID=2919919 RepID=UPI001F4EA386|nr:sensor domain-containing diguanylate cyclase [Atopomonas sediminilitoris]MCJ8167884.1 diguanylate cyclase [Atopomonas sediminilitoris]
MSEFIVASLAILFALGLLGNLWYARLARRRMLQRWPEALLLVNQQGVIAQCNQQACFLLSIPREQLLQSTLESLFGPQNLTIGAGLVRLKHAQGIPLHLQVSQWSKQRKTFLLRLRNLSEAEVELPDLRQNAKLLQRSALDAGIAAWSWDPASNELHWSEEVFRLLHLDPHSFTPTYENYLALIHEEDRDEVHHAAQAALKSPKPYSMEYRIARGDGELLTLLEHNHMQFNLDGSLHAVWGTVTDVTERLRLEKRLNLSSLAVEACTQGVLICDGDFQPLLINPAFCRMTGFPEEALLEPGWSMLSHSRETPEDSLAALEEHLGGERWYGELWLHGIKGRSRSVLASRSLSRDEAGNVEYRVYICTDITQLKLQQEQLQRLAYRDPLTGLPNRLLFDDRLLQSLQLCERQGKKLALAFIDLNGFKAINDTLGHHAGDRLLCEIGETLLTQVRQSDTVARWGGDEFAILMPACGEPADVLERLDALAHSLRQTVHGDNDQQLPVSASIGVAFFPADAANMEQLLRVADQRMYIAKREQSTLCAAGPDNTETV